MLTPLMRRGSEFLGVKYPIICGAMTWVSEPKLVSAVCNAGGFGCLAGGNAPCDILEKQIHQLRELTPNNFAVNLITIAPAYKDHLAMLDRVKVPYIIFAGSFPKEKEIAAAKATGAKVLCFASTVSIAERMIRFGADGIILEGSEAGGHLGFRKEDLEAGTCQPLEEILTEVKQVCVPYVEKYGRDIPLFPAGGIYDGADIARMMKLGAAGVQMATRFIATDECDASDAFKQAVINCRKEDITLVKSPAGLPGRALNNRFAQKVQGQMISMSNCLHCMKPCDPKHTPYCISEALIRAVSKDAEDGIVFVGANAWRVDRMMHVSELMKELITGTEEALKEN